MNAVSNVLVKSFVTNIFLSIVKIMIGILGHSHAMVADGFNSLSDLSTDIIAIMGSILSKKNSDKSHPYGYGKIEYLTNIIIGVMIIFMGVLLIINAFNFKYSPSEDIIMYVCIITIVIRVWIANYLIDNGRILDNSIIYHCGSSINRIGYRTFSINLVSDDEICKLLIDRINSLDKKL